jgi:hypothetical protein
MPDQTDEPTAADPTPSPRKRVATMLNPATLANPAALVATTAVCVALRAKWPNCFGD